jgi:hypothetical protein
MILDLYNWIQSASEIRLAIKLEFLILVFFMAGAFAHAADKPIKIRARTYQIVCFTGMAVIFRVFLYLSVSGASPDQSAPALAAALNSQLLRLAFYFVLILVLLYQMLKTCRYSRQRENSLKETMSKRRFLNE